MQPGCAHAVVSAKQPRPDPAESKSQLEDYRLDQLHRERLTPFNTAISSYDQNTNLLFGRRTRSPAFRSAGEQGSELRFFTDAILRNN